MTKKGIYINTIEDMNSLAAKRNGECLSTEYLGPMKELRWKCFEGHQWNAKPMNIRNNRWCPFCAGKRVCIQDLMEIAANNDGECLSTEDVTNHDHVSFRCSEGHEFQLLAFTAVKGMWCPVCRKKH